VRSTTILLLLLALGLTANLLGGSLPHQYGDKGLLVLGFVLISGYAAGRLIRRVRTPMITGYLLAGFFFGPHVIGAVNSNLTVFSADILQSLKLIDDLALGLIAFTAGGELRIKEFLSRLRIIGSITVSQTALVFFGVGGGIWLCGSHLPFMAGESGRVILAAAILLGLTAAAASPATTIAVITEAKARGPVSSIMLGTSVIIDVVSLMLFSLGLIIARQLIGPGTGEIWRVPLLVLWDVLGSLGVGFGLGFLLRFYIRYIGRELPLLILALSFIAMQAAHAAHLSGILICLAAGFYLENYTEHGERMVAAVERYSLPIYIVFFAYSGAKIDLSLLQGVWLGTLLVFFLRAALVLTGSWLGGRLAGATLPERQLAGWALVSQAGVVLGLANLVRDVPHIGPRLYTLIVTVVAVNQLVGPIMQRFALARAGEITDE